MQKASRVAAALLNVIDMIADEARAAALMLPYGAFVFP